MFYILGMKGVTQKYKVPCHVEQDLPFSFWPILFISMQLKAIELNSLQSKSTQLIPNSTQLSPSQLNAREYM